MLELQQAVLGSSFWTSCAHKHEQAMRPREQHLHTSPSHCHVHDRQLQAQLLLRMLPGWNTPYGASPQMMLPAGEARMKRL